MKVHNFKESWKLVFGDRKFNSIDDHIILSIVHHFDEVEIANAFIGMLMKGYMKDDNVQPPLALVIFELKSERKRKEAER
jgi:hypothetical protein